MNILLLSSGEISDDGLCTISDSRFEHIKTVIKPEVGSSLRVGIIDGLMGTAVVETSSEGSYTLRINCTELPPPQIPLTLALALVRPKSLRKVLHCCAVMGVKNIHIFRSWRSEKGYWENPILKPANIRAILLEGLSQGVDTIVPEVHMHRLFKPFAEDLLPSISIDTQRLVAHPYTEQIMPRDIGKPATLVIGPEGGFIDFEIEMLSSAGFMLVSTGPRIMRVEQAVSAMIGRLY